MANEVPSLSLLVASTMKVTPPNCIAVAAVCMRHRPASAALTSSPDDIYKLIGEFGKFQKRVVFIVAFISFSTAFNNLGYVFWAARPDFHCVPDDRVMTLVASRSAGDVGRSKSTRHEDELLLNLTVPWERTSDGQYHRSRSFILQ